MNHGLYALAALFKTQDPVAVVEHVLWLMDEPEGGRAILHLDRDFAASIFSPTPIPTTSERSPA